MHDYIYQTKQIDIVNMPLLADVMPYRQNLLRCKLQE